MESLSLCAWRCIATTRLRGYLALSDIVDNVSSWQAIYGGLSPMAQSVDTATDAQITEGLTNLKAFVAGLFAQEQDGKRFTPEEADGLSAQAEDRATAIVGQI